MQVNGAEVVVIVVAVAVQVVLHADVPAVCRARRIGASHKDPARGGSVDGRSDAGEAAQIADRAGMPESGVFVIDALMVVVPQLSVVGAGAFSCHGVQAANIIPHAYRGAGEVEAVVRAAAAPPVVEHHGSTSRIMIEIAGNNTLVYNRVAEDADRQRSGIGQRLWCGLHEAFPSTGRLGERGCRTEQEQNCCQKKERYQPAKGLFDHGCPFMEQRKRWYTAEAGQTFQPRARLHRGG